MICHFSCGATSAIATALALREDANAEILYADPGWEHQDNARFLKDCERVLFGKKVNVIRSEKYEDVGDVLVKKNCLAFVSGAPCTTELKKIPLRDYVGERLVTEEHVYGYDTGEMPRIERFKANNPEIKLRLPLIEHKLSKANCLALLQRFGIELPAMYKLGYEHSNCIGCVKAENKSYWAAIREDFPDVFDWMAKHERNVGAIDPETGKPKGAAINKVYRKGKRYKLFLDELPASVKPKRDIEISCGYSCGAVGDLLEGREQVEDRSEIDSVFSWLTGE